MNASTPAQSRGGQPTGQAGHGDTEEWLGRYAGAVMNTFGTPSRVLVRGRGARVWDADGKEYLDLLAGIAVNCLGHAHPAIVEAVNAQLGTLGHVSNFFTTPSQVRLAEELAALVFPEASDPRDLNSSKAHAPVASDPDSGAAASCAGADGPADACPDGSADCGNGIRESDRRGVGAEDVKVFLANSGTEANEAAFKIARRHGGAERPRILALEGAFHGRTMGALAITHKPAYREPFEPLPGGVEFLPAGDVEALRRAMGPDVAALFVEPIQGEAGVRELRADYLEAARDLTVRAGALLVCDEVQTGMGRTGAWMAHHLIPGVVPDVVTLAKGLGGGMPIGAVVARGRAANLLEPGQHGTTFGGNPVASAAALAVIETIRSAGLLERVSSLGARWAGELARVPGVAEVRGRGLLLGVGLAEDAPAAGAVAAALLERGFIVNAPRPNTIRLAPPFILADGEAAALTAALAEVLAHG